ncbi:hypothetical protein IHE45_19G185000 [Dioscorea alata]|uniref:Uncharacterized protein n=2 Tax=Dioscorea alata TaxID=55571 RepID=A0ACB7U4D0_DIOAL|nr:hypothetical protein IHE45_19G185000 [Dioscorea alata]
MSKQRKEKLSLEGYLFFVETRNRRWYSVDQLNQVISMHGFCRLRTKKAIIAALKPVELMAASRSTLEKNRSITAVDAGLELEEIQRDIAAIGWAECPLSSVLTIPSSPTDDPIKKRPISIANWGAKKKRNKAPPSLLPDAGPHPLSVLSDLVNNDNTNITT